MNYKHLKNILQKNEKNINITTNKKYFFNVYRNNVESIRNIKELK